MTRLTIAERKARTTRRIAVATFVAGAIVSVAANIVAAEPTWIGRAVSAWPALALLLSVHLFQHSQRSWVVKASIAVVAGVAGWASYWHMVEVATRAGESGITPYLLPLTVDAMMGIATVVMTTKPRPAVRRKPARRRTPKPIASVTPIRSTAR